MNPVTDVTAEGSLPYVCINHADEKSMPHQFIHTDDSRLEGVWRTYNGRRFCAWRFELGTHTLKTSRGTAVESTTLERESTSLDQLMAELPELALEIAKGIPSKH